MLQQELPPNTIFMKKILLIVVLLCSTLFAQAQKSDVIIGAEQTKAYFPILKNKRIAIFSNHTGMVGNKHLLDVLLENNFNVVAIFSPEHGFRGNADAGEHVSSTIDSKTGVPILSLYNGKSKKPSEASMKKFDILIVDIQDVGLRFYTYYISMVRLMDALDVLLENNFNVVAIFSPEHGFRGNADAGEHVSSTIDSKTGVPILSLYNGKSKKPSEASMKKFDILIVDIQDVGLRFYTYYISMVRLMDACAEYDRKILILDRPNPNGHYVDGPILDMKYKSGVGGLPIPIVHGMTLGELALMVNGERWLPSSRICDVTVIPCKNYTHQTMYRLPIPPSPNLPNMKAIYLYPSICLFEGTPVSLGRGTTLPFQVYGHPNMTGYNYNFTPRSIPGAKNPPQLNKLCHGVNLSNLSDEEIWKQGINLDYLIDAYHNLNMGDRFFRPFFELLVGTDYVRKMIEGGKSADEIKARWKRDVERFKIQRKPYLLYQDN